ncbi:MAG: nucleotidyl transferase AbiEii/AbiGii toxin family protein [Actinomycetota bacterium]|nr:nucleotidyl transferase AbiEii/AbiGii toxin family protein [Actinomycetota bacterium]
MTFTREHHRVIAVALGCLDAAMLREARCYFAGGTALAMRFGEYRESVDIDFIVADDDSYRTLRTACRGPQGFTALTVPGQRVVEAAPLRIDQYGIRTRLSVAGVPVKFEIIREGRITLESPGPGDDVLGIATATVTDLLATKLLANADRWADPTVFSRDIIDLAMIRPDGPRLTHALGKATTAYGPAVVEDAQSAISMLLDRDYVIDRCRQALGMSDPRAVLVDRLRRLSTALARAAAAP